MRTLLRHLITIFVFGFLCKIALQAQESQEDAGVPKALILGSLSPNQPIPSGKFDTRRIVTGLGK